MSSILNSISSGGIQVHKAPRVTPVKEDSIIDLLQNSEIEFTTCQKAGNNLSGINTGFGANNDLHYKTKCKKPEFKIPLYKDNYLGEFKTEEEKAAARHALGLYSKGDVVAMSLLTAEDSLPTQSEIKEATVKQLRKGDQFFNPITSLDAVIDQQGVTLTAKLLEINNYINSQQKEIYNILQVSKTSDISSLGDVRLFLQGFNNGDNLHDSLEEIKTEMLRFETIGQITT